MTLYNNTEITIIHITGYFKNVDPLSKFQEFKVLLAKYPIFSNNLKAFNNSCKIQGLLRFSRARTNSWARILVQVTIYSRLWIGRDGHLDQSKAYDIS